MKYFILFCLLFQSCLYSQREYSEEEINYTMRKGTVYYKDSWEPFSGVSKSNDDERKMYSIARIVNGNVTYTEVFDLNKKLLYRITNTEFNSTYDSLNIKSELKDFDIKYDISDLKIVNTMLYYNKNGNGEPKRINGFLKTEKEKFFYENGILTKIERYYDADCTKISERIIVFHSPLGNIAYEADSDCKSTYETYYEDGKPKGTGVYKNDDYLPE